MVQSSRGKSGTRSFSTFSGVFWLVSFMRKARRFTCVSTTTPSLMPKAFPRITLAVFRPTPGMLERVRMSRGISPSWSS